MQVLTLTTVMLVWFQAKHFIADYLLQPHWVLTGKGDMRKSGGYVHAGVHALGSIPAYLIAGLGTTGICSLMLAEFVIHYIIDYSKAGMSSRSHAGPDKAAYWAMHGADQFAHQLTYAALIYVSLRLTGAGG